MTLKVQEQEAIRMNHGDMTFKSEVGEVAPGIG